MRAAPGLWALFTSVALPVALATTACGEDGPDTSNFTTFQLCFDTHFEDEMLMPFDAIVDCCIHHPIGGMKNACGADKPECINYITANLDQTDASTIEVMTACESYGNMRMMP